VPSSRASRMASRCRPYGCFGTTTESERTRQSAAAIPCARNSAKYRCSGARPATSHGRIASDGLSRDSRAVVSTAEDLPASGRGDAPAARGASRLRRNVVDGVSLKRRRYCCANLPKWLKPKRVATSVTEVPSLQRSSSFSHLSQAELAPVVERGHTHEGTEVLLQGSLGDAAMGNEIGD
jgi:hypothetical protein